MCLCTPPSLTQSLTPLHGSKPFHCSLVGRLLGQQQNILHGQPLLPASPSLCPWTETCLLGPFLVREEWEFLSHPLPPGVKWVTCPLCFSLAKHVFFACKTLSSPSPWKPVFLKLIPPEHTLSWKYIYLIFCFVSFRPETDDASKTYTQS